MKLSVIIVNYNVRAYLEQCLSTVEEALIGVAGDIYVVDNQSTDGSVEMVRSKFPNVKLIANSENVGFSRANNQAIRASDADYVVLLNPDTVVGEDVFRKVIEFMDAHPKAGGLGVKMIDGKGNFLPESKRGLPTPAVAFYKIIGITRLFPQSRIFGRYHMGHLPENATSKIEILSGACMFLRKSTLDEVGLLDESFFMYGEDIDLSYRITLSGYENWYYPDARIIHYKGESTKKSSVNYVFVFYNAMAIFAQKHFTRRGTDFLGILINGSIYLSAAGAIVVRFLRRALLPMLDLLFIAVLLFSAHHLLPGTSITDIGTIGIVVHALICVAIAGLFGAYDLPVRLGKVAVSVAAYVVAIMSYGLISALPTLIASWIVLVSAMAIAMLLTRLCVHALGIRPFSLRTLDRKRILAIGTEEETKHALALLWQTHFGLGMQRVLTVEQGMDPEAEVIIRREIRNNSMDEVVFCAKNLPWGKIIELMETLRRTRVMFKIAQPAREFIIGPSSIESLNDLFILPPYAVYDSAGKRLKRVTDIGIAMITAVLFPITLMIVRNPAGFMKNWWAVIRNEKTWVGYTPCRNGKLRLPAILPGVLHPLQFQPVISERIALRSNITYAKDHSVLNDMNTVIRGFKNLGGL